MRNHLGTRGGGTTALLGCGLVMAGLAASGGGCGDDTGTGGAGDTTASTGDTGGGSPAGSTTSTTTGGGGGDACTTTAPGETRGSAIAISPDDRVLVAANRDVGTVSIFHVDYTDGSPEI